MDQIWISLPYHNHRLIFKTRQNDCQICLGPISLTKMQIKQLHKINLQNNYVTYNCTLDNLKPNLAFFLTQIKPLIVNAA